MQNQDFGHYILTIGKYCVPLSAVLISTTHIPGFNELPITMAHHHEHHGLKGKIWLIAITIVLFIGAIMAESCMSLTTWQLLLLYLIPYLLIGHGTLHEAWEGICDHDPFNENLLMSIATIGAMGIGFIPGGESQFPEAVFVMLFFQIGELLEAYAEGNSRRSIAHLMDIRPDSAHVLTDGNMLTMACEEVPEGSIIEVRPGEKIPIDGIVIDGKTALNTMALTGESVPRNVGKGDEALSGCINMSSTIRIRTTRLFAESTVSKILNLVENANERKSKSETFISKFAHIYTPIVVFAAIAIAGLPPLFASLTGTYDSNLLATWILRALTFLVVSCPCALVISVPLTFFGGIGGASRKGILIKGASFMDVLANVKTVVFDKTGTLTNGIVAIEDTYDPLHPTISHDEVKADAAQAIKDLIAEGVRKTVILSGDKADIVAKVADIVGVNEYFAELLPDEKVGKLEQIMAQNANGQVAFVGDGINDAPVISRADIGISMGALGSDAAIEAADVVLMDDKPSKIALAIGIAKRTITIAKQNVVFAIAVKIGILILAACGLAGMWLAAFGDVGVMLICVLNAIRALK